MPAVDYTLIREDIIASLRRYAEHHTPTGRFLRAVLENNLMEAFARADEGHIATLFQIVAYVYNELPSTCWGSKERVEKWLAAREVTHATTEG